MLLTAHFIQVFSVDGFYKKKDLRIPLLERIMIIYKKKTEIKAHGAL